MFKLIEQEITLSLCETESMNSMPLCIEWSINHYHQMLKYIMGNQRD